MQEELGELENLVGPVNGDPFEGDYFGRDYGPQDLPGIYEDSSANGPINYLHEELVGTGDIESEDDSVEDNTSNPDM